MLMAVVLLVLSVVRIGMVEDDQTVAGFMISFYFVIFAIIFIAVECNLKKSRLWFFFLNSSLGKALFYIFLFLLCFGSGSDDPSWVDVLLAVIFSFISFILFVIHCIFKDQEAAYIDSLIAKIK